MEIIKDMREDRGQNKKNTHMHKNTQINTHTHAKGNTGACVKRGACGGAIAPIILSAQGYLGR